MDSTARRFEQAIEQAVRPGAFIQHGDALRHLDRARECWETAEVEADWIALVDELRRVHRRKSSFMPGFERVVRRVPEPSFIERTKKRWSRRCSVSFCSAILDQVLCHPLPRGKPITLPDAAEHFESTRVTERSPER